MTDLRYERYRPARPTERLRQAREHDEVGVKRYPFLTAHLESAEAVLMLQPSELALNRYATTVKVLETIRAAHDAREHPPADSEGQDWLILLSATDRNDRLDTARLALPVNPRVVVALVSRHRLGLKAASLHSVKEWREVKGFLSACGFDLPRERQARHGADSRVNLVAVEATTGTGRDSGAVTPGRIGVGELLALFASLADVALTIRVSGKVGGVNRYVSSKIRVHLAERLGASIEARAEHLPVLTQLRCEAATGPVGRRTAEDFTERGMLADQRSRPRPRRKPVDATHKDGTDQGAGSVPLPPSPVSYRFNCGDQVLYFGTVENRRYVADDRATRYFSRCQRRSLSCGHAPGSSNCAGALFRLSTGILEVASDGITPGGGRARRVARHLLGQRAGSDPRWDRGKFDPARTVRNAPQWATVRGASECGRRDSNPQSCEGAASKAAASTSFATPTLRRSVTVESDSSVTASSTHPFRTVRSHREDLSNQRHGLSAKNQPFFRQTLLEALLEVRLGQIKRGEWPS